MALFPKFPVRAALAIAAFAIVCPAMASAARQTASERAVRAVLDAQAAAWNRGDIDAFMDGYDRSDSTRFASGGTVVRGWKTVRDRYKARYATREKMGTLSFTDLELTPTGPKSMVVFGRWRLDYAGGGSDGGLFTLLFERKPAGWRIVADHTSSQ